MNDSLSHALQASGGIPDIGTRITILVAATFVLAILVLLLYLKKDEVDEKVLK